MVGLTGVRGCAKAFAGAVVALIISTSAFANSGENRIEPFGLATSALPASPLQAKWKEAERAIERDSETISLCRRDRDACASPQVVQFVKIVESVTASSALARVGEINRAINLAIRPMSDLTQHGVDDRWTSPLATFASGAGDCEDYAIAKLVALREVGVQSENLRLVILREENGDDHAVVAVRIDGQWRILDNRHLFMLHDTDIKSYRPVFAFDEQGAKRFDQPTVVAANAHQPQSDGSVIDRADIRREDAPLAIADISSAGDLFFANAL